MKKSIILIAIMAWLAVITAAVLIMGGAINGGFTMPDNSVLLKEESIPLAGIDEIQIETDSLDIEFIIGDVAHLQALQFGSERTTAEELFNITHNNGCLKISVKSLFRMFSINFSINERLVLEIPASWLGDVGVHNASGNIVLSDTFNWQNVDLSSSSGDLLIKGALYAEDVRLHATSGNIISHQALTVAGKLNITSSSGDIRLNNNLQAQSIYAKAESGNIFLEQAKVRQFELRTSSGDIRAKWLSGGGYAAASSGNIVINLVAPLYDIELVTSSGDIRLDVEEDISFDFMGRCSSGDISANFPLLKNEHGNRAEASVGSSPTISIRAEATSGNICVDQR